MGTFFDKRADTLLRSLGKAPEPAKQPKQHTRMREIVTESVVPIKKQQKKIVLVKPANPYNDSAELTAESLEKLGFVLAPKEDYIGASDETYVFEAVNESGRATIVYDFVPTGNHGKPALHLYYNSNTDTVTESVVCFSAEGTVGEMRQIIDIMEKVAPTESRSLHDLQTISESIEAVKQSIIT